MTTCAGTRKDGTACTTDAPIGSRYCYHHDPARAEERSRKASRAATLKHNSVAKEIREMREIVGEVIHLTATDKLNPGAKRRLTEIVQLLQTYALLAELELAAGGKPGRGTVALGADLYEKLLQRFIAVQEGKQEEGEEQAQQAREGDGEEAELPEMEALAEDYISMTGKTGKDAAALRHVMGKLGVDD